MIIEKVEDYCSSILEKLDINKLPFHNIHHTRAVVSHVKEICTHLSISQHDTEMISLAAWFHDIGYINSYQNHEDESIRIAHEFLSKEGIDHESLEIITSCINATRVRQLPQSQLEKILCDADLYHLGSLDYFYWLILLRREWAVSLETTYKDEDWYNLNLKFLQNHDFLTEYGKFTLRKGQASNILKMDTLIRIFIS